MISPFEFFGVTRICFGRGQIARLGEIAGVFGKSALVIFNGPDASAVLTEQLRGHGIAAEFHRQRGEPTVADIDAAVAAARKIDCAMLIGIGGGSAIDAAKATAGILTNGGSAADYLEVVGSGKKITQPALPWIAVPTTAGTGAEVTRNAVIGLPEKQFKASIRSEHLLPRAAIVDPDLGLNVPPVSTARSGMDALCQLIESYTSTGASPLTDALAISMVGRAARALPVAYVDGCDVEARSEMALAALVSGMTLTSAGLGAVHGFAAPIGANFPAPHGAICAALLPHIIKANLAAGRSEPSRRTIERYGEIGRILLGGNQNPKVTSAPEAVLAVAAGLVEKLKIGPLSQFGMQESDVPAMVALARKASSMRYNPVVLTDAALAEALSAAIRGDALAQESRAVLGPESERAEDGPALQCENPHRWCKSNSHANIRTAMADLADQPPALAAPDRQAAYALSAGFLGWMLDAFDFFLVVVSQNQIAAEFHRPNKDVLFTLFLTLAFRPLGALIFGLLADRFGRRMPMIANILFYSTVEVLTGLTHNFRTFCVLRALFGIGMGGEWGVGASLVMEKVGPRFRGLLSGLLQEGYAFGFLLAAIARHYVLLRWGWRPMFFLGGAPALLALFIRFGVRESEVWQKAKAESWSQLGKVLAGHWPLWLYLTALMAMMNCSSHGTQDVFPDFLKTSRGLAAPQVTNVLIIMNIGAILGGIIFGLASDRLGRRRMMIAAFIGALAVMPLWAFSPTFRWAATGAFAMQFFVQGAWGIIPAHISELSPDSVRGFLPGFAYQCGNLIASPIQYAQAALVDRGHAYPHVMAISAAIIFCAAILVTAVWHERRGIRFGAPERIGAPA